MQKKQARDEFTALWAILERLQADSHNWTEQDRAALKMVMDTTRTAMRIPPDRSEQDGN